MRLYLFLLVSLLICHPAVGEDAPLPTYGVERKAPPGMEGLVWNKWDTDHFVVLSIDKSQGSELFSDAESLRAETLARWALSGNDSFFCKLVCVPDADMLRKLFGLKEPKCEVRRSKSGDVELAAIWIDHGRIRDLPSLVAEAELEFSPHQRFLRRGLPILERDAESIRASVAKASDSACSSILDERSSAAMEKSDRLGFDASCALLCLMIRREYGSAAFGSAVRCSPSSLHEEMGFRSASDFDKTFARYRDNLLHDIESGDTPDEYLSPAR